MDEDKKTKLLSSRILNKTSYDPKTYEYDSSFKPWNGEDPLGVHTTAEMLECLGKNPNIELDARVLCFKSGKDGKPVIQSKKISKENFTEAFKQDTGNRINFKEGSGFVDASPGQPTLVGQDFTPFLGGPFYKNLYYYQDYIRMHAEAFYAYHNDPFAKAIVQITRDFVLGSGYDIQCDSETQNGKVAMAAWKAFEDANDLQVQIDQICEEISIYGEIMIWKLPDHNTKITYRLGPEDTRPVGIIPRVRLIDPSNIVEIVTYPEDITRPLFYVWLQPTQYQIYTSANVGTVGAPPPQPTLKFIYRQIPADQMLHYKINAVSNEKRGRSDFFPVLGYLKRLRDSVEYAMIGLEKVSAWSIDTTIEGDQTDIDSYVQAQAALPTIPTPGSEFIHSKGIQRNYIGNANASHHSSDVFSWCLSCIATGVGIPVSYFGTHLSWQGTRASALVSTEPVAKKMEKRRELIKRILNKLWGVCMESAGLPDEKCNVVFPEIITQDRSQKLKDLLLMEQARWIKPERAATIAASEMGIDDYSYGEEMKNMKVQLPDIPMPLIDPSIIQPPVSMEPGQGKAQSGGDISKGAALSGLPSTDKKAVKDDLSAL